MARTIGPYGSSAPAGQAVARRTVIGSRSARDPVDRLVEEAGDADARRALEEQRPRPAVGGVVEHGGEPREAASRPTNRALVYLAGMRHSRAAPSSDRPAAAPHPRGRVG